MEDRLFTPDDVPSVAFVRNRSFDGPDGPVPVRLYHNAPDEPSPVVVFYHGGGWILGTLDSIGGVCRELARRTGCVVVSVDYRLAPEHPFPAPLDDAYTALEWVAENASTFGGDPEALAVAGTSAGGNLAASVALRARDFDGPDVAHQLLLYPMTDCNTDRTSYRQNATGALLSRQDVEWFWDQYCHSPVDTANPYASVLRASDHGGLPSATVVTAGHDPLCDEGRAYADALAQDGTPTEHLHYSQMAHGFLSLADEVPGADDALATIVTRLREALA